MFLPGTLRSTTLGDVLGQLYRGGVSGVLQIISQSSPWAGSQHHVALISGVVGDVATALPTPRIGEVLLDQGVLRPSEHQVFVEEMGRRGGALAGAVLQDLGMVSQATLRLALSRQMRVRLDALYSIQHGDLRFHPLASRSLSSAARLGPQEFLHGRPRARDRAGTRSAAREVEAADEQALAQAAALDLLGLTADASRDQVRQAFRRAAVLVHPDLHTGLAPRERDAMNARFAELSRAYHLLITARQISEFGAGHAAA